MWENHNTEERKDTEAVKCLRDADFAKKFDISSFEHKWGILEFCDVGDSMYISYRADPKIRNVGNETYTVAKISKYTYNKYIEENSDFVANKLKSTAWGTLYYDFGTYMTLADGGIVSKAITERKAVIAATKKDAVALDAEETDDASDILALFGSVGDKGGSLKAKEHQSSLSYDKIMKSDKEYARFWAYEQCSEAPRSKAECYNILVKLRKREAQDMEIAESLKGAGGRDIYVKKSRARWVKAVAITDL